MSANTDPRRSITVCVPTYNGERYLRPCLDSILCQTFCDFELLLVDDCSTDSTPAILSEYAQRDARVCLSRNANNLGLVGNWNNAIHLASGEWVKFVFQDDLLRENCLERMLAAASRPVVFCRRDFLFEKGTSEEVARIYSHLPSIPQLVGDQADVDSAAVRRAVLQEPRNFFGEPTAALLHRSLFARFGLFNADLAQLCDLEYWIRVTTNTGLTYVSEPLVSFRYHASSTSANNREPLNDERVSVFDRLVMLHEFAYNEHYRPLRREARHGAARRNFKRELADKAVWVHAQARALAGHQSAADLSWLKRWDELVVTYPHLEHSAWQMPHRLRELWMRHAGWLLRR